MGFDTNGNWTSDFYPEQDRDDGIAILASKFQQLIQTDIKSGFDNCLTRDGAGKPEANLNFNGHKITNLGDAELPTDAVTKSQLDTAIATPASEEDTGTISIATTAEAIAGEDDTKAMTPLKVKEVIDTLSTNTAFAVNSGYATNGVPDLLAGTGSDTLSFKVDDGTTYKQLVCTTADRTAFSLDSVNSQNISGLSDGTYNVFVDSEGNSYCYQNVVYKTPSQPTMNVNDIWLNTCEPFKAYIKTADGLVETGLVQLPQTITVASAVISSINYITVNFNDNGVVCQYDYVIERGGSNNVYYTIYKSGFCEQWGYVAGGQTTVTFAKTYTGYPIVNSSISANGGLGGSQVCPVVMNVTSSGCSLVSYDATGINGYYWVAKGFVTL